MPVWWSALVAASLVAQTGSSTAAPAKTGLTKLPELVKYVEAPYPATALAEKREGVVQLAIDVDAQGVVQRVEVVKSAGLDFDAAAMQAACGFEFEPAEAAGLGPVPVRIFYKYGFVFRPPEPVLAGTSSTATSGLDRGVLARRAAPINLSGTVREAGTRAPIPMAFVEVTIASTATVTRTSTLSDERGRFAFRGLPPGRHAIAISAPFFERSSQSEEVREGEALEVLYYLTRTERSPYEVIVRGKIERKEVARRTLRFEEIERIPGTQGDAIRVIQNLPGVARTPFGLGLLVVRGAPPQDTGVFLDGHRLPLLFHFGGIGGVTSVLNSRGLEAIDFLPGGFGPEQGRVSAGAVELRSKPAATDRVHGEAVVDIAGASMFIEGPVSDDPRDGAFTLALRRSYVDGVLAGVLSALDADVALAPRYYDYQARYDRPIDGDPKKMLTLFVYGSDDELLLLGAATAAGQGTPDGTQSRTYFHRINPRFTYTPSKDTSLVISPLFGVDYTNTETTGDPSGNASRALIRDVNFGARIDGAHRLEPWLKLNAGVDALYYAFTSESELPVLPTVRDFPSPIPTDVPTRKDSAVIGAFISSVYAEAELTPLKDLYLWPGLRLDYYGFSAEDQPLIDPRLVEGRSLWSLEPRISGRYRVTDALWVKGQFGQYRQPPLPPQFYLNADLPLQEVEQYSGGIEWQLAKTLSLDLQGFYRWGSEFARFSRRVQVVNGQIRPVAFEADLLRRSYGSEVLLRLDKTAGLFGWIAYTLSRSEQRRDDQDWRSFFFFDQTHNLTAVASYELGLNWTLSARFRFVTGGGLPTTQSRWYDADRDGYQRDIEGEEQRRAPPFHQLDLRIDKRWVWDEWYLEAYLDVQNVYNATNTELYAPSFDFKSETAIPSLPIFPLLGVKGVF
ncbi:TonB-dependent receptor [Myxococcota bacterium]|nr:TonB-dependent receptor [Myxococcota bacterium]